MAYERTVIGLDHGWQYKTDAQNVPPTTNEWLPALDLPSTVHQDLIACKVIPDPFLENNEEQVQWVGEQNWTYRKTFTMSEDLRRNPKIKKALVFEGLDTYATVWLNDIEILKSENMFLSHRMDISDTALRHDEPNLLEVKFENAELKGDQEVEQHPDHIWRTFNSGEARLATRKAQYHYGWDWGPRLMTAGLWRPAYIELFESRISDFNVQVGLAEDFEEANLRITIDVEGNAKYAEVAVEQDGSVVASQSLLLETAGRLKTAVTLKRPKLWWPHTFGPQHMYLVRAALYTDDKSRSVVDTATKRIGLRKVELIQHPFPNQDGSSFFFKINDVPIFGAGSNWIPGDSFLPRITASKYRKWIQAAKDANQVMIRVWGGGIYEDESFYDACDEMGLLVWQDFMFACGMFPAYNSFLDKVEVEARDNLRKIRHHPSIALLCGNNEDYVIPLLSNIEYNADEKDPEAILKSPFPARYTYEHLLPKICKELAPDVPYWPGSPFGGAMVNSPTEGDIHQWHVWHLEKFPYQDFPKLSGRFVSEFGMQAMPCHYTARDFFPASDKLEDGREYAEDEYVQYHNKCGGGAETLHKYCKDNLPLETKSLRKYIYCTQILQSETVATAFRSWRRLWRGEGKEYCGGALIWQLNDCYPVTSWSLLDSYLRPKMGYWAMKRENKPITAGLQRVQNHGITYLEVWAVNTSLIDVKVDVLVRAWNVAGGQTLWTSLIHENIAIPRNRSIELGLVDPNVVGLKSQQRYKDIVFAIDLIEVNHSGTMTDSTQRSISQSINFHEPLKEVPFDQPSSFQAGLVSLDGQVYLEITSSAALKGVLIEMVDSDSKADDIVWEDNGFDLLPNQVVRVPTLGLQLGDEHRLTISWLGGEWHGPGQKTIKPSL